MKTSIGTALEKVVKVYQSCETLKQYVVANKYRSLFNQRFVYGKNLSVGLCFNIRSIIDKEESDCLERFKKRRSCQ